MENLSIVTDTNEYQTVYEQSLYTRPAVYLDDEMPKRLETHKAIVNKDGDPIAVVGKNYNVVQDSDIMPQFHDVIMASSLDKTGMTKKIEYSHNGAKTKVVYTFPAHQMAVDVGDFVQLQIMVLNSCDGTWKFMSMLGAVRLACMNGQVVVDAFSSYSAKHTKSLDTDVAIEKLETALEVYEANVKLWQQFAKAGVTNAQATAIFEKVAGKSDRLQVLLEETFLKYKAELGTTVWALFN
jgi:hypothetical protein